MRIFVTLPLKTGGVDPGTGTVVPGHSSLSPFVYSKLKLIGVPWCPGTFGIHPPYWWTSVSFRFSFVCSPDTQVFWVLRLDGSRGGRSDEGSRGQGDPGRERDRQLNSFSGDEEPGHL